MQRAGAMTEAPDITLDGEQAMQHTAELEITRQRLHEANERLKAGYFASIKVFSTLIDMRGGHLAGHARRVADLARRIAVKMELDERQVQEIFVAGLLHDVGKLGFPDELLAMPVATMTAQYLTQFRSHPVRAEQLLMPLPELRAAATSTAAQLERFDGNGFPKHLAGQDIPLGARILSVASDYDSLQIGTLAHRQLNAAEARTVIQHGSGKRYDPEVVNALLDVLGNTASEEPAAADKREKAIAAAELLPGMVLSRDLIAASGLPMLSAGQVLDDRLIRKVQALEKPDGAALLVHVRFDRS